MKFLFFIILTGYAVRCDDNNYYVIEVPEEPLRIQKTFKVYWNVPTMQCASKRIPFENLFEKFGIIQNENDSFKGEKVTIMYDPGLFPALFKNESSGKFMFRNGGVPQEGDLDKHLKEFQKHLVEHIPDDQFDGVGIIDFESWRPVFRQNFGNLQPYRDVSIEIERERNPFWKKAWIEAKAKKRFTDAARLFMERTLVTAKTMRPRALWGFYGFPYCFNMASNNMHETCARQVPEENDEVQWLWSTSTALFPSVYSSHKLSAAQLAALIRGRIQEATRHRRDVILPYFWYKYRDGGFLSQKDLNMALSTLYNSAATGILLWGSSNDVNTIDKCNNLFEYIENVFGPAIAKYTKPKRFNDVSDDRLNEIYNTSQNFSNTATESSDEPDLDPDYHWAPPENYTEDIKQNVEKEIIRKHGQNISSNTPVVQNNVLIDYVIKYVLNTYRNTSINDLEATDDKGLPEHALSSTTEINTKIASIGTSQVSSIIVTNSPINNEISDRKPQLNIVDITSTESTKSVELTTETHITKPQTDLVGITRTEGTKSVEQTTETIVIKPQDNIIVTDTEDTKSIDLTTETTVINDKEIDENFDSTFNFNEDIFNTTDTKTNTIEFEPFYETTEEFYSKIDSDDQFFNVNIFPDTFPIHTKMRNAYFTTGLPNTDIEEGDPKYVNKLITSNESGFESNSEFLNKFTTYYTTDKSTNGDLSETSEEVIEDIYSDVQSTTTTNDLSTDTPTIVLNPVITTVENYTNDTHINFFLPENSIQDGKLYNKENLFNNTVATNSNLEQENSKDLEVTYSPIFEMTSTNAEVTIMSYARTTDQVDII